MKKRKDGNIKKMRKEERRKKKEEKRWNVCHTIHGTPSFIQYPTNRNPAQYLPDNAITVFGPRLYNSLLKYLRDIESVNTEIF